MCVHVFVCVTVCTSAHMLLGLSNFNQVKLAEFLLYIYTQSSIHLSNFVKCLSEILFIYCQQFQLPILVYFIINT